MINFIILFSITAVIGFIIWDTIILDNSRYHNQEPEDKIIKEMRRQRLEHYVNNPIVKEINKLK